MNLLETTLEKIEASDKEMVEELKEHWDSLGKPLGSLGTLEEISMRIGGITGKKDNTINKKAIVVLAGDNGVYEENIASSPKVFTKILVESTAKGITGVCTLAEYVDSKVVVADLGVDGEIEAEGYLDRKIAYGTKNFTKEPAMTYEEAVKAIEIGIEITDDLCKDGYDLLGVGELGIGNTTTSSAVLSVLSGLDVETTCGLGSGLTDEQYENKLNTIRKGIEINKPDKNDPIDVIAKVGGFDIAGMVGVYLSAAKNRVPVVMDGFISSIAALCAIRINENVRDYIFTSHLSKEAGAEYVFEELGMKPIVDLEMRLGEGSGCPLAFQIIETALYVQKNMGTFKEMEIDSSILLDMREDN